MRKSTNKSGPSIVAPKDETTNSQPSTCCPPKETEWNWETIYKDRLRKLLETGFQSDLTIVVKSTEFRVHKILLQSGSRVFNDRIKGCSASRLILEECSADPEIFQMLLNYLYVGDSGITTEHALGLLKLATEFEITELRNRCAEILQSNICLENVIDIFNEGTVREHKTLITAVIDFICLNGQEILALASFNQLHVDGLVEILKQDSLRVRGEMDVFNAVYRWGEAQLTSQDIPNNPSAMRNVMEIPLKHIRFPLMSSKDFREIVKPKGLLEAEEAYSLLEAILLRNEEPGAAYLGFFSITPRQYNMGTLESGVGRLSVISPTRLTSTSQQEITVHRACVQGSIVTFNGDFGDISDVLCFLPPRDGMIHRIAIRAACFERVKQTLERPNWYTGINMFLGFYEMAQSSDGQTLTHLSDTLKAFGSLTLTFADTTNTGGILSAKFPHPIPFNQNVWKAVVMSFPGCPLKRVYMSPCLDEYVHQTDPSVVFKFRGWTGGPVPKSGLLDHFVVTLT